jgi:hypothetical protein
MKIKCTNSRKKARMLALLVADYMIRNVPEDKNAETHKTLMRLVGRHCSGYALEGEVFQTTPPRSQPTKAWSWIFLAH